jgi:N-acetylglucosamine malate deacetylase 2
LLDGTEALGVSRKFVDSSDGGERSLHQIQGRLPRWRSVLVVGAHPDDESFGLGAVLAAFVGCGTSVSVLSFTHGEASTLGAGETYLANIRSKELHAAGRMLGVAFVELLGYPDAGLAGQPLCHLVEEVHRVADAVEADGLLVFDEGGITGHPDHCRATEAALAAAELIRLPVLAWAIPDAVAAQLNGKFGTSFLGRAVGELDIALRVDRTTQRQAIAKHRSQSADNPVLWTRLQLLGDHECLRWLKMPAVDRRIKAVPGA